MARKRRNSSKRAEEKRFNDYVPDIAYDLGDSVREELDKRLERVEERITILQDKVRSYIKQNPEVSVLIALGVGALIGSGLASSIRERIRRE